MSICQAFRLRDLRPCRSYCHPESNTCLKHHDFYDKTVWMSRFLNLQDRRFLLQGLDYSQESMMGRIQTVIEFSLNSGKIVLTEPDVAAMVHIRSHAWNFPNVSMTDVFIILCGTGKVLPEWNHSICCHAIYNYFKMYFTPSLVDVIPSMESRIGRLLANPATSPALILKIFTGYFQDLSLRHQDTERIFGILSTQERFIKEALLLPQMRSHLLLSDEKLTSYFFRRQIANERLNMFPTEPLQLIKYLAADIKTEEKARHKQRMLQYKEGIAMAVWHPNNVSRWLQAGGWPLIASIAGDDGLA
jgi:hypothetical protein